MRDHRKRNQIQTLHVQHSAWQKYFNRITTVLLLFNVEEWPHLGSVVSSALSVSQTSVCFLFYKLMFHCLLEKFKRYHEV